MKGMVQFTHQSDSQAVKALSHLQVHTGQCEGIARTLLHQFGRGLVKRLKADELLCIYTPM